MKFEFSEHAVDRISADIVLVFAFAGNDKRAYAPLHCFSEMDAVLDGQLIRVCELEQFSGKRGEMLSVIPQKKTLFNRVVVVGLGKKESFVVDDLRRALGVFTFAYRLKADSVSLRIPEDLGVTDDLGIIVRAISEGLLLGGYVFGKYKAEKKSVRTLASVVISEKHGTKLKLIRDAVKKAQFYARATILARDLVNEPASVATPTYLANFAKQIAKGNPEITCKVFDKEELEKMGMGAFLAVAKASDTPPKFIHLSYTPKHVKGKKTLAIVGKGITFDTGGISLKPADSMKTMKLDMSGAAAVLSVFSVISQLHPDFSVLGLIAATPNLVSGTGTVPGDVASASNGKTIEILNTDAEGRVTMADSFSYALKQGATHIIDLATLTGACMVALGNDIAGLFSNNRDLADLVKACAHESGEKVWELPLEQEYKQLNKSDVADIANIASSRYGGAITAALFLEEFVDNKPWVHLDISGPAFAERQMDISPKGGTGFGVRTVLNLLSVLR